MATRSQTTEGRGEGCTPLNLGKAGSLDRKTYERSWPAECSWLDKYRCDRLQHLILERG